MIGYAALPACTFHVRETARVEVRPLQSLDDLEEEIVVLAAHIHAAEHRLLTLVAEFDRRRGW